MITTCISGKTAGAYSGIGTLIQLARSMIPCHRHYQAGMHLQAGTGTAGRLIPDLTETISRQAQPALCQPKAVMWERSPVPANPLLLLIIAETAPATLMNHAAHAARTADHALPLTSHLVQAEPVQALHHII